MNHLDLAAWIGDPTKKQYLLVFGCLLALIVLMWRWADKYRAVTVAAFVVALLLSVVHQFAFDTVCEDAFISYRYAYRLSEGDGFTFNPGERVEGYSNFLWVVLLGGARRLFGADIVLTARVSGVLLSMGTCAISFFVGRRLTRGSVHAGLIAMLLLASASSFAAWGAAGLENALFAFLLMATVLCAIHRRWVATGLVLTAMSLTRVDGVVFAVPFFFYVLLCDRRWRTLLVTFLPYIVLYLAYTVWRVVYFGHLLPNTVAAKGGSPIGPRLINGLGYIYGQALGHLPLLILLVVPLIVGAFRRLSRRTEEKEVDDAPGTRPAFAMLIGLVLLYTGFIVFIGGDWMPAGRFLYVLAPCFALVAAVAWCRFVTARLLESSGVVAAILFGALCFHSFHGSFVHQNYIPDVSNWKNDLKQLARMGQWFNQTLPDDTLIAVFANGVLSYQSQLPTIDMLGLTDEHIARKGKRREELPGHQAYDFHYVISRKPALAIWNGGGFFDQPRKWDPWPGYDTVVFQFADTSTSVGGYVQPRILRERRDEIIAKLDAHPQVRHIKVEWPPSP